MSEQPQEQPQTSALIEVLKHWTKCCLEDSEEPMPEELQKDSRTFFLYLSRSTQIVTSSNIKLETRSSHEDSLVKLVQDLEPAFSAEHHEKRLRALHVLVGAVEGCKNTQLSNTITQLLGKFLLGHCGPIDDDKYGEDYDSMIRNAAIKGLTALVEIPNLGTSDGELLEAFRMRLEFALKGIQSRCASALPDSMDDSNYYGFEDRNPDLREGLSTLPRSKRSLCFGLVRSAVKGVVAITDGMERTLEESFLPGFQKELVEFVRFATSCLHGESDPRCLLELLTILHEMQIAFEPYFLYARNQDLVFPGEDIFDAVAPYFPIQFTPPPNNIHDITREGLHASLLSVLTYTKLDDNARIHGRYTMLNLSTGLFIEQLLPLEGEENPAMVDKFEAIQCLSNLLFPMDGSRLCEHLDIPTLRNLWTAIKMTHDESSLGISKTGEEGDINKVSADQCRDLVSKLAFQLETSSNKALWDAFVSEPLQKQTKKIKLSPSNSKLSIAYIACLAASGGPRTLRFCLGVGLETLLEYLREHLEDTEDAAVAAHGIGAFFSSFQVAMERARKEGVVLHPHPLESYAARACQILLDAFDKESLSLYIKIGATRALEFLLLTAHEENLEKNQLSRICSFVMKMLEFIKKADEGNTDLQNACCMTLGTIVGKSLVLLHDTEKSISNNLLSSQAVQDLIKNEIYPALLQLGTKTMESEASERYDRKALSVACSCSQGVSKDIISSLLESLAGSLNKYHTSDTSCIAFAECLSYMLQNGGDMTTKVYHQNELSVTILNALCTNNLDEIIQANVARLALPNTSEENTFLYKKIRTIVMLLLPAYKKGAPQETLIKLAKEVSDIVPPLSDTDNINLYVKLPFLGAALGSLQKYPVKGTEGIVKADETSLRDSCISMLPGLTDYVMSNEHDSKSRSSAASCIYAIVPLGILNFKGCPVLPLIKNNVNPYLLSANNHKSVRNGLNLMALLGSAAARRGTSSSNTAGEIAKTLVELACSGKSSLPFSSIDEDQLDLSSFSSPSSSLELLAASTYGQMLAIDTKPLMKQRLTHTCLKYTRAVYEEVPNGAQSGKRTVALKYGLLVIVCHVICTVDLSKIDKKTLHQLASVAVEGLSSSNFFDTASSSNSGTVSAKNLVLVAILKLISVAPKSVSANGFLLKLVTGLLKAYAVSDPSSEASSKLLALQGLEAMAHNDSARKQVAAIQPAVVAVLAAAINHPSGLLRQAAVDVRNAWYLIE